MIVVRAVDKDRDRPEPRVVHEVRLGQGRVHLDLLVIGQPVAVRCEVVDEALLQAGVGAFRERDGVLVPGQAGVLSPTDPPAKACNSSATKLRSIAR
ncbi:hypothetical protein SANT12839_074500 [Streptomyces antimycoticus]|uniref:Uncharacterized protein n=1 Tax=Streptomyces antimycoticus TaxID=68175 RepID=A0A4D4KJ84_9ACTN|nr:hypothetical protein SANT12839_074500 [Streptomyces antimycoticus]